MKNIGNEEVTNEKSDLNLQTSLFMLRNDILIIISGINEHIGSVTLAQPYEAPINPNIKAKHELRKDKKRISASISTLTQFHHRDDQLLAEFARHLSQQLNRVVAVVGGIHVDNISKNDIEIITTMFGELEGKIIKRITGFQN